MKSKESHSSASRPATPHVKLQGEDLGQPPRRAAVKGDFEGSARLGSPRPPPPASRVPWAAVGHLPQARGRPLPGARRRRHAAALRQPRERGRRAPRAKRPGRRVQRVALPRDASSRRPLEGGARMAKLVLAGEAPGGSGGGCVCVEKFPKVLGWSSSHQPVSPHLPLGVRLVFPQAGQTALTMPKRSSWLTTSRLTCRTSGFTRSPSTLTGGR